MKKVFISSFLVLAMSLTGCQDAIDITQKGELTEEVAFQTVSDLKAGMNIVYMSLSNSTQVELASVWTDEVGLGYDNGGQGMAGEYTFSMNSGNGYALGIYQSSYSSINRANRLLSAASRITPDASEQEDYDRVIAEAKFIRAYAHFQLLTYFSQDLMDPTALGVPAIDYVPLITDAPLRDTNAVVLALIQSDLADAATSLPTRAINQNTFVNHNTIKALQSRIALFTGDYPTALSLSNELIAAYPLADEFDYLDIWYDLTGPNKGVIFKLERMTGQGLIAGLWQSQSNLRNGSSFYEVGRSLFNKLDDNDIRKQAIVNMPQSSTDDTRSLINDNYATATDYRYSDILLINKYPGSESVNRLNDHKIFRIEEQYFIKAEVQARNNDFNGAAATIQEIVNARYTSAAPVITFSNLQQATAGILDQRRIELAFEGHRFIDLKRLGQTANRGIDRDSKDIELFSSLNIPATNDHRFILPIPAREVTINPGLIQNTGY